MLREVLASVNNLCSIFLTKKKVSRNASKLFKVQIVNVRAYHFDPRAYLDCLYDLQLGLHSPPSSLSPPLRHQSTLVQHRGAEVHRTPHKSVHCFI